MTERPPADRTLYVRNLQLLVSQLELFTDDLAELLRQEKERLRSFARTIALMVESYDETTGTHLDRTVRWATAVARQFDRVPPLADLELGFLLHDVGKYWVRPEILTKPGPLDEEEWRQVRLHPLAGAQLAQSIPLPQAAVDVIRCHHERWDGQGYPRGLAGEDIPLGARIFSVVDVFDALVSDRPYRPAMTLAQALEVIEAERGRAFDPQVVDAFLDWVRSHEQVEEILVLRGR